MKEEKIDFVMLWVNEKDPEWQKEKNKYEQKELNEHENVDNSKIRYRDRENLKYWFRGVEKFAPWANKIHFITCGHIPEWLNINNPKLHIVKHSEYMPARALPTFNSNAIELLIHKIQGLEENFVLFNDDMFLTQKVKETDFFIKGKPCNTMALTPIVPMENGKHYKTVANNIEIINKYFDFKSILKKNIKKYTSFKQGKYIFKTYPLLIYNKFVGFANFHLPLSYKKSTFEMVWTKEEKKLQETVYSRFRDYENNISHWLFNYWQFASGEFYQKSVNFGKNILINDPKASKFIIRQKYKTLGLGDSEQIKDFENVKNNIIKSFERILPEKSSFEL